MVFGTVLYVPLMLRADRGRELDGAQRHDGIGALLYAALFAMCVAYTIWYTAVRDIGSARTSVYSNLIPIVAMLTAVLFLASLSAPRQIVGAALVLAGVALTRLRLRQPLVPVRP